MSTNSRQSDTLVHIKYAANLYQIVLHLPLRCEVCVGVHSLSK